MQKDFIALLLLSFLAALSRIEKNNGCQGSVLVHPSDQLSWSCNAAERMRIMNAEFCAEFTYSKMKMRVKAGI